MPLPSQGPDSRRQVVSGMCYFEQHMPCQALHSGVARPMRSGYPDGGSNWDGKRLDHGARVQLSTDFTPKSGSCSLYWTSALEPTFSGKHFTSGLPSNNAPGCIATRFRVPGWLSPTLHVRPLPNPAHRPRGSALLPLCKSVP